jgi:hypothetical protein
MKAARATKIPDVSLLPTRLVSGKGWPSKALDASFWKRRMFKIIPMQDLSAQGPWA